MMTGSGAPAASSCAAMICAAPLNIIADIASVASGEMPAAIAPMPHTIPNGTIPISAGVMSRTPSKNAGLEKCERIGRTKRKGRLDTSPNLAIINLRSTLDAARGQSSDDPFLEHRDQQRDRDDRNDQCRRNQRPRKRVLALIKRDADRERSH